jgi:hypothetical protein
MKKTLVLAMVCLFASEASAGTISLEVSHRAELRDGELHVALTLKNGGDESAHSVTPRLRFRGAEARGATQAVLPPGQPQEDSLVVPATGLGEGVWPYEIVIDYADANLYPFQANSLATLTVGSPPLAKVTILPLASPILADRTQLGVHLKNVSAAEQRVAVRVLAPEAIEAGGTSGEGVRLDPWQELEIPVELTNRAALPGSRYPLFVAVEYEDGPAHQTLIAQTIVEIRPADAWVGPRGRYLWIAAAIFGGLFVVLLALRFRKR